MHKGKNRIRKRGSARLSAAVFLLSAGMLQAGIQCVSASEADFITEEVILSGEEETPQTDQSVGNPQHEQNTQSEQAARSGQNIQSGQDARDAQSSKNLPDQAGSRNAADTDPAQRGEGGEKKESTKSGKTDDGKNAGQQFYTPDAASEDTLQTQEAAGAQKAGGAVRGQPQTEQREAEQPAQQIRLQADTHTREKGEDMLFWGMLFVAVGLFLAGTYRLRANTFMRW